MAYRFRRKESVADGIRRIVREEMAAGVSLLADRGNNVSSRIHDARRHLKRLRALLRLGEPALDKATVANEDEALTAAARRLSTTRDADVSLATLEALTKRLPAAEHEEITEHFRNRARHARRKVTPARLEKVAIAVRKSGLRIAEAKLRADGWALIRDGLERSLRGARKLRIPVKGTPDEAALHEWRTRAKRLFHQLELLQGMFPKAQRKLVQRLEQLCACLGKHHDLHVLEEALGEFRARHSAAAQAEQIATLIERRRKQLLRRIRKLSAAIFRSKTKTVLRSIHAAWKSARKPSR